MGFLYVLAVCLATSYPGYPQRRLCHQHLYPRQVGNSSRLLASVACSLAFTLGLMLQKIFPRFVTRLVPRPSVWAAHRPCPDPCISIGFISFKDGQAAC